MTGTDHMNIILGQANTINEVHNIRKQNLELNQQLVAQTMEEKKKEDRSQVQRFEDGSRVMISSDEEKKDREGHKENRDEARHKQNQEEIPVSEGNRIDIKV